MRNRGLPKNFKNRRLTERGGTLIEFAVVSSVFFLMLVGIVAAGNLYYTHNALVEATRRGARFATLNRSGVVSEGAVQNVVVYGTDTPALGATSLIYNLQTTNVTVDYHSGINLAQGTVTVSITNYSF
ncbi:MAG: TadE/TadG family type IV pilus assembly protein, partial [Pyrinomonadaceae bacterium]